MKNREAGDLRRHGVNHDVTVMSQEFEVSRILYIDLKDILIPNIWNNTFEV